MAKDAYWFPHDSNARHDPKLARLRMKHGLAGVGFWWCCVEFLRDQDGYEATREEFETLEFEMGETSGIFETLISKNGLLDESDGMFFSQSLKNRMFEWDERKRKLSEAGKRGGRPPKAKKKGGFSDDKAKQKPPESNNITLHNNNNREESGNSDAFRVAEYLLEKILTHKPDFKKPNLDSWAKDIDKAIRLDKRTPKQLCEVVRWAHTNQDDTFWRPNLLSGKKLREKFDQITIKIASGAPGAEYMAEARESWSKILRRVNGSSTANMEPLNAIEKKTLKQTKEIYALKRENASQLPFSEKAYIDAYLRLSREENQK